MALPSCGSIQFMMPATQDAGLQQGAFTTFGGFFPQVAVLQAQPLIMQQ
eukprot:CAMPEP_0176119986 /NCGR_PEP_ID=MMETSP0120_2-20121206/60342_1 /TAXON_ID=160619 /ORGANISM="Kryptoperidinium foliaceum, Strain CCMP 1326" /LENGTH=48 /DNA_ID= /DNA_START= /DNA_END= /DNA_ORIENTATION=